jgi:hypothetical protein
MTLLALLLAQAGEYSVGKPERNQDATVRTFQLSPNIRRGNWAFTTVFFTEDGASALLCEARGQLRRISRRNLSTEAEALVPETFQRFALSRAGILGLTTDDELLLIDARRLEVLKTLKVERGGYLASSPGLDVAFITSDRFGLATLDLTSWQIVRKHDPAKIFEEFNRRVKKPEGLLIRFSDFAGGTVCTPDGRYLLCGYSHPSRFAISGFDLLHEEIAKVNEAAHTRGDVSADSKYFMVPGGASDTPSVVVSTTDLQTRIAVIPEEYKLIDMAVDSERSRVIGLQVSTGAGAKVDVFTFQGAKTNQYALSVPSGSPLSNRLFLSPDGKVAVVPFNNGLLWLEWTP